MTQRDYGMTNIHIYFGFVLNQVLKAWFKKTKQNTEITAEEILWPIQYLIFLPG